jgi:hypothetical protein
VGKRRPHLGKMHNLCCQTPSQKLRLAWISLQTDGSISFGLNKTFISPKFKERRFIWNAYNRVRSNYIVQSDSSALEAVRKPHFTYHPPHWFHLKDDGPSKGEALFEAIADLDLTLRQEREMPWIRAISDRLSDIDAAQERHGALANETIIAVPDERLSVRMELDFVRGESIATEKSDSITYITWRDATLRVRLWFAAPSIATLAWFYFG